MYCDWVEYGLKKNNSGVYMIKNIINGKVYIGSASNLIIRLSHHLHDLKNNKHHSLHLQRAWNKNDNYFIFGVLEFIEDKTLLVSTEQKYIDLYKSYDDSLGYNICPIAGSSLGSKKLRGKEERSLKMIGDKNFFYNKKHKPESLKLISDNSAKKILSAGDIYKIKELCEAKILKQYEIAKMFGVHPTHISKIYKNKSRTKIYN